MNIKEKLTELFPNNIFDITTNKEYMIIKVNNDRSFRISLESLQELLNLSILNMGSFQDEVVDIISNDIRPFIK